MIKNILLVLSIISLTHAENTIYSCKEHSFYITKVSVGHEHINYKLLLNNKTLIKELFKDMWLIKTISCTSDGFKINTNHQQYGDLSEKVFTIVPKTPYEYNISFHSL